MNCSVLTDTEYGHLSVARGISGGVCFILAIGTAVSSFLAYRSNPTPKGFLDHLFLYLTVVTALHTGLYVVETAVEAAGNKVSFCKALGFFLEWVGWVQLSTAWLLILCLIYQLVKLVNDPGIARERVESSLVATQITVENRRLKTRHYSAILLGWTPLPLIFTWIPLTLSNERYEGSHWCWIASISEDCSGNKVAFIEEMVLWYTPVLVVSGFSFCLVVLMAVTYGGWACWQEERIRERISRNLVFTAFILVFSLISGLELAARTHTAVYNTHHYAIWLAYAVLVPWRDIALPLGYSVSNQNCCKRNAFDMDDTSSQADIERSAFVNIETVTAKDRLTLLIHNRVQRSSTVT